MHAILMALHVAGAELDPKGWLLRYAVAALGPYFTFGLAYWFATLSVVFGESFMDTITWGSLVLHAILSCFHPYMPPQTNFSPSMNPSPHPPFIQAMCSSSRSSCSTRCVRPS